MSVGVREGSPDPPGENVVTDAVLQLDRTQGAFLQSLDHWARLPIGRRLPAISATSTEAGQAFHDVVTAIIKDDEVDFSVRADQIATIFMDVEAKRLAFIEQCVPSGQFEPTPLSQEAISRNLQQSYIEYRDDEDEDGDDDNLLEMLGLEITNQYMGSLNIDLSGFLSAVQSTPRAKAVALANGLGRQTLEVGKTSAAVAIGSLAAHRILKKLGEKE